MKKLFSLISVLSFLFISWDINAQWITIDSIKISPAKLVRNDTAGIILAFHTAGTGKEVFFEHTIVDTTIFIRGCYTTSGTTTNTYHYYYISLGTLKDQSYSVIFTAFRSFDDAQCTYHDSSKENLKFIVDAPLSVKDLKQEPVSIYPNPANKVLFIDVKKDISITDIIIQNIQGNTQLRYNYSRKSPIDISCIPPGMYFIYFNTEKGRLAHRFIKE